MFKDLYNMYNMLCEMYTQLEIFKVLNKKQYLFFK